MSLINEALKQLKEDWNEEDILSQETFDALKAENKVLWGELDNLRKVPRDQRNDEYYAKYKTTHDKLRENGRILDRHEVAQRYFAASDELATEDDWDEVLGRLPEEFDFEDLEIEVETEEDDEPTGWNYRTDSIIYTTYPAQHGYINSWSITIEPTQELVSRFLNKPIEEITGKDLAGITEDDYYEFILNDDECLEKVKDDALTNYDYDDVSWDEPEEPDYDDYD